MKARLPFLLLAFFPASLVPGQAPMPVPVPAPAPTSGPMGKPGEPQELLDLRQKTALRALASAKTLAEQYAVALSAVARDAGNEGDYEQALAAQKTKQDLADLYARSLDDPTLSNVIVLRPGDAKLNGAVIYDRAVGDLTNWRTAGSIATWEVPKTTPGKYNVTVTYTVAPMADMPTRISIYSSTDDLLTGGEFEFYEDSSLAGASMNRRTGQVKDTGGWDKPAYLQLAAVTINRASTRFALKITRTNGSGGVMRLKEIRLSPVKEGEPAPGAPQPGPDGTVAPPPTAVDEVAALKETHKQRLQDLLRPIVGDYTGRVTAMAEAAKARNEDETAEELLQETQTVQRLVDNPNRISTGSTVNVTTASLQGQGFKEMTGARYVPSANNTGDSFLVTHLGETTLVRLMWVSCPPPTAEAEKELKACGNYFNLGADDVLTLGKQAKAFAESYLQDKPLRILSRGIKDEHDRLLAVVQPEGVGDFAGVLVDNGLACVNAPLARSRGAKRFEEMTLNSLKERESLAKARPIPPGAWALMPDPVTDAGAGAGTSVGASAAAAASATPATTADAKR